MVPAFDIKQTLVWFCSFVLSNAIKGPKLSECNYIFFFIRTKICKAKRVSHELNLASTCFSKHMLETVTCSVI